jgi:hypothetical protein
MDVLRGSGAEIYEKSSQVNKMAQKDHRKTLSKFKRRIWAMLHLWTSMPT